jgi:hypothetical protein
MLISGMLIRRLKEKREDVMEFKNQLIRMNLYQVVHYCQFIYVAHEILSLLHAVGLSCSLPL